MSRSFDLAADYQDDVEQVHKAFCDEQYWLARLADSGADESTLDSIRVGADGRIDVVTTQVLARDRLPAIVAQIHKGDLVVKREESWTAINGGEATGHIIGTMPGVPLTLSGTGQLTPHPDGVGARLAMERALAGAGFAPKEIDYINLHGTATLVGDAAEDRAVAELFGAVTPCSSTKGYTGHTLGASGIIEALFSALSILNGVVYGSVHTRHVDPQFRSRYLLESASARVDRVISNSFGFGGANCSLLLGRAA